MFYNLRDFSRFSANCLKIISSHFSKFKTITLFYLRKANLKKVSEHHYLLNAELRIFKEFFDLNFSFH
jgi:hypothetical protein